MVHWKTRTRQTVSITVTQSGTLALRTQPKIDNNRPPLSVECEIRSPFYLHALWDVFILGILLGASAMCCAGAEHIPRWPVGTHTTWESRMGSAKQQLMENADNDKINKNERKNTAIMLATSTAPSVDDIRPFQPEYVSSEIPDTELVSHPSDAGLIVGDEYIELDDLDQLEEHIYGPTLSTDDIMRRIHDLFAPELEYRPMEPNHESFGNGRADNVESRETIIYFQSLLGRFAIRQDNLELLQRTYSRWKNEVRRDLWSLLEVALEFDRLESFEYLLSCVEGLEERTRIMGMCAHQDRVDMMAKAFSRWTKHVRTDAANAPLVVAATKGHIKSVRFLLMRCTDVEGRVESPFVNPRCSSPVLAAASGDHKAIVSELIAAGATIDETAFHTALDLQNAEMLSCLIFFGASVIQNKPKVLQRCLELAIETNHLDLARLTFKCGCKPVNTSSQLLLSCCKRGRFEILHGFIDEGADVCQILPQPLEEKFAYTQSSIMKHELIRHQIVLGLLQEHCSYELYQRTGDIENIVSSLAWFGDTRCLEMYLRENSHDSIEDEINQSDKYGHSPLFDAMYNHMRWREGIIEGPPGRWLKTIRVLLAHGAKLNMRDGTYWTVHYSGLPKEPIEDLREFAETGKLANVPFEVKRNEHLWTDPGSFLSPTSKLELIKARIGAALEDYVSYQAPPAVAA